MDELSGLAEKAVEFDRIGNISAAIHYYSKIAELIYELINAHKISNKYKEIANKYLDRCDSLRQQGNLSSNRPLTPVSAVPVEEAQALISRALTADESGLRKEALDLYMKAAEFCLEHINKESGSENGSKMKQLAKKAVERAEELKAHFSKQPTTCRASFINSPSAPVLTDEEEQASTVFDEKLFPRIPTDELDLMRLNGNHQKPSSSSHPTNATNKKGARRRWSDQHKSKTLGQLDKSEMAVLATTSRINNLQYVPFMECDLKEQFIFPILFTDKDGHLPLSEKQRQKFKAWARPDEFLPEPTIIDRIDSGTIKQTIITDCSFVASLAIAARYERRFGNKLITHIIFPQNKNGEPMHNPSGKYMVKLHINGIWRKVIIDDLLPIGHKGELLCSYSQNRNELWVSLLEKAYIKVMGGYDFPGSNSNIDLNALTGWIPERIPIHPKEPETFDAPKVFDRLFTHFHQGHCLITLATGPMDKSEQERTGLVDAHAYAVLDLRIVDGKCLFLVKNPWTHLRWKGRFSENDLASWTPELCAKLDYNPKDAQQFDDGVFWIDYPSVCNFFDVFYVNWDPALFPFSNVLHASWNAGHGPVRDLYTVGENPQYFVEVNNRIGVASIWILLSRHITEKEDFANNREYITVMVYKNDGKRVYLPYDPKPITEGTRINSPHYLCQLLVKESGLQRFTLVIAQYEKMKTIHYSLRIYSSSEFKFGKINIPYKVQKKIAGSWRGETAGGCGNGSSRQTYLKNPQFHLDLEDGSDENSLLIDLRGPKEYSIGFEISMISSFRQHKFEARDSGPFRSGCTVLQLEGIPAGAYSIRPMTFLPGQEGPFIIRVHSTCNFSIKLAQP